MLFPNMLTHSFTRTLITQQTGNPLDLPVSIVSGGEPEHHCANRDLSVYETICS